MLIKMSKNIKTSTLFQVTDRFGKTIQNQLQPLYRNISSSNGANHLMFYCFLHELTLIFFRKHSIINN